MNAVVEAIKEEIRACCPTLIDDGTRPFRAHWRNFAESWLEVVVASIKIATSLYIL